MTVNNMDSMTSVNTINSLLKQAWGVESISTTNTQLFVSDATKTLVAGSYKGLILKLIATINPKQDLHGYDKPWVGGAGKNKFYNTRSFTSADVTYTVGDDASEVIVNGTSTGQTDCYLWVANGTPSRPFYLPNGEYTISVSGLQGDMRLVYSGNGNNGVPYYELKLADNNTKRTFTVTDGAKPFNYFVLRASSGQTFDTTIKIQIESGSTATDWTPYSNICPISGWEEVQTHVSPTTLTEDGTTYTTDLPETVYGGTLDVVSGVLTAYPFYPSYNGETLGGRWICDRAVYVEGTTPPTGSQVALISGMGTTYQLTPKQVTTRLGTNNVWADSGDVTVEYWDDTGTIKTDSGRIVTFNII